MAGPVTHIILALQLLPFLPHTVDKQAFIVGTTFPDIRYMTKLSREVTHIEPVSWQDVVNEPSAFRAGMLVHNLVDIIRIMYLEPAFYDRTKLNQYTPSYIRFFPIMQKTAEDAYYYRYRTADAWKQISSYFDTLYPEELDFGLDEAVLRTWHAMIQEYIADEPMIDAITKFSACLNNSPVEVYAALHEPYAHYITQLLATPKFQETAYRFDHAFITYLTPSPARKYSTTDAWDVASYQNGTYMSSRACNNQSAVHAPTQPS